MQPLEERMEELGGGEFLEVFVTDDGDDEDGGGGVDNYSGDDDFDDNGGPHASSQGEDGGAWGRRVHVHGES